MMSDFASRREVHYHTVNPNVDSAPISFSSLSEAIGTGYPIQGQATGIRELTCTASIPNQMRPPTTWERSQIKLLKDGATVFQLFDEAPNVDLYNTMHFHSQHALTRMKTYMAVGNEAGDYFSAPRIERAGKALYFCMDFTPPADLEWDSMETGTTIYSNWPGGYDGTRPDQEPSAARIKKLIAGCHFTPMNAGMATSWYGGNAMVTGWTPLNLSLYSTIKLMVYLGVEGENEDLLLSLDFVVLRNERFPVAATAMMPSATNNRLYQTNFEGRNFMTTLIPQRRQGSKLRLDDLQRYYTKDEPQTQLVDLLVEYFPSAVTWRRLLHNGGLSMEDASFTLSVKMSHIPEILDMVLSKGVADLRIGFV